MPWPNSTQFRSIIWDPAGTWTGSEGKAPRGGELEKGAVLPASPAEPCWLLRSCTDYLLRYQASERCRGHRSERVAKVQSATP